MTTPIPNCPQPETPIRERAWMDEQKAVRQQLIAEINDALTKISVPETLTLNRAEYFKAGARACIHAVKSALGATP